MVEFSEQDIEARRLLYLQHLEDKRAASHNQADMAKWLLVSLLTLHGAAFAFSAQDNELSNTIFKFVFWPHVFGIIAILLSGFSAWWNWSLHAKIYDVVDPRMIWEYERWPKFDQNVNKWIKRTYIASLVFGIISVSLILLSAFLAFSQLIQLTIRFG